MISKDLQDKLISLAKEAQKKAYVPYSNFHVGAAILSDDGDIFTGCNIENVCYALSLCGERTAIFKMMSEKGPHAKIKAIAVSTETDMHAPSCGSCRQVIQEFSTPETIVIYKSSDGYKAVPIAELLPDAFTKFTPTQYKTG